MTANHRSLYWEVKSLDMTKAHRTSLAVVDLSTPEPDQLVAPVVDLSTPEPDQR
jgi:hypothetical protein